MRVETIGRLKELKAEVAAINIIVVGSGVRTAQLPWASFSFYLHFLHALSSSADRCQN